MEINWICKNCRSEVPNTMEICWNCQSKRDAPVKKEIKQEGEEFYSKKDFDLSKIQLAGKQLKNVGRTIIFLVIIHIIFSVFKALNEDLKPGFYYLYYLALFVGVLVAAGILFSVGDTMQEILVKKKKEEKKK